MKEFFIRSTDGFKLSTALFEVQNPKAIVSLVHGSLEHKERYYDFIKFLNQNGYGAIIADNRGHGKSTSKDFPRGFSGTLEQNISDIMQVTNFVKTNFPSLPIYMFGHSLGSVFARVFLQKHDAEIKKLVLSGTVNYNPFAWMGICLAKLTILFKGENGQSKMLNSLAAIKEDNSWLSYNTKNLENYKSDPLNTKFWQNAATLTVFEADRQLNKRKNFALKNPDLQILSVTGKDDPVTGGKKGLEKSLKILEKIGYKNVSSIVYDHMKHEILNEEQNQLVYNDVLAFFEKK